MPTFADETTLQRYQREQRFLDKMELIAQEISEATDELKQSNDKAEEVLDVFEMMNLPVSPMGGMFYGRKTGRGV